MEIIKFAPVVIPTLNRFDHLKRCIESLEKCTGAQYTDVYVGLDYPPSEKYVEGWEKIDTYLTMKETSNGFRNLYVRRRKINCGVGKEGSNADLLYREMKEVTDRYIFTEDDNEFSPCFLDYMNKAFEKYKDDERVILVCGYSPFDYEGSDNVFFAHQMFAWGIGTWLGKRLDLNLDSMETILTNFHASMKIYKYRPVMLNRLIDGFRKKEIFGDVIYTCYCELNNKYCIFPSKSLVRNWGEDGTGLHCKNTKKSSTGLTICTDCSFDLDNVEVSEKKEVRKMMMKVGSKKWYGHFIILLRYTVWHFTKQDIFAIRRSLRSLHR